MLSKVSVIRSSDLLTSERKDYPYRTASEVCLVRSAPKPFHLAVATTEGEIRLVTRRGEGDDWESSSLRGHRSAVLCICFQEQTMFSGGKDCDVVVWDLVRLCTTFVLRFFHIFYLII